MLIKVLLLLFYSWNTSKQHKARTIEDIESCAGNSGESYSVKYCPLLPIDLDHVVPDELHWFLHVMDVLLENVHVVLQPGVWCTISDLAKGLWFICTGLDITRRSRDESPKYLPISKTSCCSRCITQLWKVHVRN